MLATARIAGIMAAKRTHELIPLCHPLPLSEVTRRVRAVARSAGLRVEATAKVDGQDRGRDGGADRGLGRLPHHLRHVQGGRPGDVASRASAWWKRPAAARAPSSADGSAFRRRSSGPRDERHRAARSRECGARRGERARAGRGSCRASHPAALRRLGHGRLCGARRRRGRPPRDAQADRRVACRRAASRAASAAAKRCASSPARPCRAAPTPS